MNGGSNNNNSKRSSKSKRSRSYNDTDDINAKKSKTNIGSMIVLNNNNEDDINWNDWVAATATRNYLLDDGLLDVLQTKSSVITRVKKNYQENFIKTIGSNNPKSFISSIMQQGVKFERKVYDMLVENIGHKNIINIGGDCNPRSKQKYLDTIKAIKNGIPIIYQGVVRNYKNQTYGIPDLLVRSDYLGQLVKQTPPGLINRKYYVVIDIKFKTLHLKSDGIHLRNDGPMKAYKSQLCIYNQALGLMQGYTPSIAYILGWKWKYVSKNIEYRGDNCFDRLGSIDYKNSDHEFVQKTQNAISWIRKVRNESDSWDLSKVPLPYEELYPNMCNRYDFPHHKLKKKFAEDIEEISLIWKCGPKQRRIAHENGIYSWKDPRCTPELLGIGGEYTSTIVARILEANRSKTQNVFPKYINNNFADWKNPRHLEFFVDFEMTCSVFTEFDDLPYADGESIIFMIGVGYVCPNEGNWVFRDFTVDRLDRDGEFEICSEFSNYVFEIINKYDCFDVPSFYHWSHAEPSAWNRAMKHHSPSSLRWYDFNWVDLLKVFQMEPIGIKGCLNYSLKIVAKTLYKHGYIKSTWDNNSSCADGADAAVGAYRVDKETRRKGVSFKTDPLAQEIMKYNEIDCKVLEEIITYLRINHIDPLDSDLDMNENIGDGLMDMSDNDLSYSDIEIDIRPYDNYDEDQDLSDTEFDPDEFEEVLDILDYFDDID